MDLDRVIDLVEQAGEEELVHVLLQTGADPNARDDQGRTPLPRATEYIRYHMIDLLDQQTTAEVDAPGRMHLPLRKKGKA